MKKTLMIAAALAFSACGGPEEPAPDFSAEAPPAEAGTEDPAEPQPDAEEPAAETVATGQLEAGKYCYFLDDEDGTEGAEIEVSEDGSISGEHYGTIHQVEQAYYASFTTILSDGVWGEGNLVTFQTVTEVDGDTQIGEAVWKVTLDSAGMDAYEEYLRATSCDTIVDDVFPPLDE